MTVRTRAAPGLAPLILAGLLAVSGCSGSGSAGKSAAGSSAASSAAAGGSASTPASSGSGSAGLGPAACTGGLTGAEPGVIRIVCNGPARVHVTAGSLTKEFTGGQCEQAGDCGAPPTA